MEEKVKPMFEAGKPLDAEVELDRLLEKLDKDAKRDEPPKTAGLASR